MLAAILEWWGWLLIIALVGVIVFWILYRKKQQQG